MFLAASIISVKEFLIVKNSLLPLMIYDIIIIFPKVVLSVKVLGEFQLRQSIHETYSCLLIKLRFCN